MGGFRSFLGGSRHRRVLACVLLLAFGLRLAWILAVEVDPREDFLFDMTFYELAAQSLTHGVFMRDFDGVPTAKWSPGYPLLLGGAYLAFGTSLLVGKLLNALLATLCCGFVYLLGRRLFGPAVGVTAAFLLAVAPGDIFYAALLLSETAFTTAFTAALWLFVVLDERRPDRLFPRWFGYGALIGAAILIRGTAGLFLAVPIAVWWASRSFHAAARNGAVAALGLAAVVAPWTLRNAMTLGAPVLVSTQQVGMALTFAHSEVAEGGYSQRLVQHRRQLVERFAHLPNPEKELAEWRFEVRRALAYAFEHPLRELSLVPHRLFALYAHDHAALPWYTPQPAPGERKAPVFGPRAEAVVSGCADAAFYALLALALLGLPRSFARARPAALALPLAVAYVTLLHGALFAGDPRFHAPLLPAFAILAAAALWRAKLLPHPADAGVPHTALATAPHSPSASPLRRTLT